VQPFLGGERESKEKEELKKMQKEKKRIFFSFLSSFRKVFACSVAVWCDVCGDGGDGRKTTRVMCVGVRGCVSRKRWSGGEKQPTSEHITVSESAKCECDARVKVYSFGLFFFFLKGLLGDADAYAYAHALSIKRKEFGFGIDIFS
jgi:hypothetical protein